jgi:hypothetical protein
MINTIDGKNFSESWLPIIELITVSGENNLN